LADSKPAREEIASRIRTLRRTKGLSIERLAALADISAGYLSEVERGLSELSGTKLARIAENLGTTVDFLLSGREDPADSGVTIPAALSEAAKTLDLTYSQTLRLLKGKESLVARRSGQSAQEWTVEQWMEFYRKVHPYL